MNLANDIDFQFVRSRYGWSQARLYLDGACESFYLTHVFDDPLAAIVYPTIALAKGANEINFSWFDEPGQYDWKIEKVRSENDLLKVTICVYDDLFGTYNKQFYENNKVKEISFVVARDFWINIIVLEANKIATLLCYEPYKIDRNPQTFPWQELKELKRHLKSI